MLPLALIAHYYEPVHILSFNVFLISVLLVGTAEHSGYDFAQPPVSKVHDLHHEKFNVNYGSLHFMDWLHGTDSLERDPVTGREISGMFRSLTQNPFCGNILPSRYVKNTAGWEMGAARFG